MLFGAFFGAFCAEPGTASQSVLYAVAVALMGGHFLNLLADATGDAGTTRRAAQQNER